jgi:hypothetical protein
VWKIYTSPHVEIKVPNFSDYVVSLYYYKAIPTKGHFSYQAKFQIH